MQIEKLVVGSYAENCYIVYDENSPDRDAFIIDPGFDGRRINEKINTLGVKIHYILLTHGHFDHIGAVEEVRLHTGAPVWVHPGDIELIGGAFQHDAELSDGKEFTVGSMKIRTLYTPGHTQGGCCFYLKDQNTLFSGDTLFYTSVGRTDLGGGNHRQLIQSIQNQLMVLPDQTEVYPGHSVKTVIGHERAHNMFLQG
ncbi:MAG: MBL fold metallo-hydrolase [Bacillota bacterium]|nr:MBL fold metallo-hydrolase [Bacillota bacterium]